MIEVAVAVVSWNTRELLDACLGALSPHVRDGRAEVWVVDNGSADGSAALVRERHPWAKLLESDNAGFGAAVNRVAARTVTPWIAAANADTELTPGALPALLRAGDVHPRAGAIAPRLVLGDGSPQQSVHPFPTVPLALMFTFASPTRSRGWAAGWRSLAAGTRTGPEKSTGRWVRS